MKNLLILIFVSVIGFCNAQELKVTIDHTVDYEIQNRKSKDTITIGFSEDGKYLWTNYSKLGETLSKSIFKNNNSIITKSETNILYNTNTSDLYFALNSDGNIIFFKIDLKLFIPTRGSFDEDVTLISEKTDEAVNIFNKEHNVYRLYPDSEPNESIFVAYDENIPINNNAIFSKIIEIALSKTNSEGNINTNLTNGLILQVKDDNKVLLKAIKIENKQKNFNINYSFKISE